jgi:hypothetical protein
MNLFAEKLTPSSQKLGSLLRPRWKKDLTIALITNFYIFANAFWKFTNSLVPKVNLLNFSANWYMLANLSRYHKFTLSKSESAEQKIRRTLWSTK